MSGSEDEYDTQAGGAIELSEEDFANIDALSAGDQRDSCITRPVSMTHLNIEVEDGEISETCVQPTVGPSNLETSPFKRYRPSGRLSVTDLVAPTWCEVQYEYGLQQHRSRNLKERPESFITREGKEIKVEKKTAQLNDTVLREGHAVHSALEREVHPTQVQVHIKTLEDEWGLRLLNMLGDVQTMMLIGKCREFPVVGFIQDHLIIGVIDEIHRVPLDENSAGDPHKKQSGILTSRKHAGKRVKYDTKPLSPEKQLKLDSFLHVARSEPRRCSPGENEETPALGPQTTEDHFITLRTSDTAFRRTHTLKLIDSKTRLSPSLPQYSAALGSRLQLMTYKRLLDALVSVSPPFNFARLWENIGVDPQRNFSDTFLEEISSLGISDKSQARCLNDLEGAWRTAVWDLSVNGLEESKSSSPVSGQLTLVYRLRGVGPSGRQRRERRLREISSKTQMLEGAPGESSRDNTGLGAKGSVSLDDPVQGRTRGAETYGPRASDVVIPMDQHASLLEAFQPTEALDLALEWAIRESLKATASPLQETIAITSPDVEERSPREPRDPGVPHEPPVPLGGIIGQQRFTHDDVVLDAHITNVLKWWHGVREPRGVAVQDTYRCHTCEYMSGCEWREKKAMEALEQGKAARV